MYNQWHGILMSSTKITKETAIKWVWTTLWFGILSGIELKQENFFCFNSTLQWSPAMLLPDNMPSRSVTVRTLRYMNNVHSDHFLCCHIRIIPLPKSGKEASTARSHVKCYTKKVLKIVHKKRSALNGKFASRNLSETLELDVITSLSSL